MSPAAALLAHVEQLAHPRRMRELALFARGIAGTPELHDLLADLAARGPYERRVALHMAMAVRDLDHVARALAGPDLDLRRAALRAVRTLPVPDDDAARVLDDAPEVLRRAFYRTLLHARRHALADRLLPEVRERWGEREAAALLPACGPATVARSLDGLVHAVPSWRAIGKHHPGPLLDLAERRWMAVRHWTHAAHADPARVLALLERRGLGPRAQLIPEAFFALLARTDPGRTGRLLLGDRRGRRRRPGKTLRRYLRSCPDSELLRVVPSHEHTLACLLASLPAGRRGWIFRAAVERRGGPFPGLGALRLLDLLPPADAAAEARRMLDWHGSVWHSARARLDDPALPLRMTAYLPYDEASGPLAEAATDGDPRRRGPARTLLVECAARTGDPVTLTECVGGLAPRLLNERDPLRGVLPEALARVRPHLLTGELVPDLRRLSATAIEAKDSSAATRRAFGDLAARVLRHLDDPALVSWALETCGAVIARDGARGRLDLILRRGQEHDLLDVLRPHLDAARERGDLTPAISLARALRRRAFGIAELQDDLRTAAPGDREAAALWLAAGESGGCSSCWRRRRRRSPCRGCGTSWPPAAPTSSCPPSGPRSPSWPERSGGGHRRSARRCARCWRRRPPTRPGPSTSGTGRRGRWRRWRGPTIRPPPPRRSSTGPTTRRRGRR
ncbi:hypothetical protein [Spirillospora sp. CA-294931]|uniref:hypothetical protein n=1 Tax=Spirillospora sp. CA-294931 TaxID=3240042 RepID=UPI003D9008DB